MPAEEHRPDQSEARLPPNRSIARRVFFEHPYFERIHFWKGREDTFDCGRGIEQGLFDK